VQDKAELSLPSLPAFISFEGLEDGGGESLVVGLKSALKAQINRAYKENAEKAQKLFTSAGVQYITINAAEDITDPVVKFFKQRARKLKR
jgi:hypothetical protein